MVKIDRKENPTFTHYSDENVKDALKLDFFKRCYLCEEVTRHYEVEHFYPQKYYEYLKHKYKNLFYVCQKCNKIKPKNINIDSNSEIINCCEIEPNEYIKLKLNTKECRVEVEQIQSESNGSNRVRETIKLLNRIYNGENSKSNSCEDLKDDIKEQIEDFRKKLDKYQKSKLKRVALKEVVKEIAIDSSYVSFKKWIIKDNKELREKFQDYL